MKHIVFSVFDQKAKAYLPPFVLHSEEVAIRTFGDCINAQEHQFGKHPEDYVLFKIGDFDDVDGTIESFLAPLLVIAGVVLVKSEFGQTEREDIAPALEAVESKHA